MRVGFIGCGEIAPYNAAGIAASTGSVLTSVMDLDAQTAGSLGDKFGARSTTSLDSILEDPEVDAVVVAVPHHLHADVTLKAAEAGKHVIVEKPIATTLADADRMISACSEAGVALSILFSFRYEARLVKAREAIEAGAIGDVIATSLQFMTEKPASYYVEGYDRRVQTDWRGSWEKAGGGVLLMNCCHMLDYYRHLTGLEVVQVAGMYSTDNSPVEVEDTIAVSMVYEGGAIGAVQASGVARGERWRADERIWGTHGSLELSPTPRIYTMRKVAGLRPARWQKLRFDAKANRIATFFDRFAAAVASGEDPDVTGEDGRANLALILAAYEAANSGRTVSLAQEAT